MTSNAEFRLYLARFRCAYVQCAMDMRAAYAKLHPSFEVPQSVNVPHSFVCDQLEIIYVDHMARFVKRAAWSGVRMYRNNTPLYYIEDSLLVRRWNLFEEAPSLLKANNILA